jgi:hypothetical protein
MAESKRTTGRGRFQDLTGRIFARLTVVKRAGTRRTFVDGALRSSHVVWECRCECGGMTHVQSGDLKSGNTGSCGCLKLETVRAAKTRKKHGLTGTPEWNTWQGVRRRCRDPLGANYVRYGARGVIVCRLWFDSAAAFCADVGPKPSPVTVLTASTTPAGTPAATVRNARPTAGPRTVAGPRRRSRPRIARGRASWRSAANRYSCRNGRAGWASRTKPYAPASPPAGPSRRR